MKFIDANLVEYRPTQFLTYDDIALYPLPSDIKSRQDVNTVTWLTPKIQIGVPIISANMDTITEADMAIAMGNAGGIGILHRFYHPKYEDPYGMLKTM